jgi:uncharacterized protein (TIRG00374 family)
VVRYVLGLAALGAAVWAINGKTGELEGATGYLTHLRWWWVGLAVVSEALSYLAMAAVQRDLLAAGELDVGMVPLTGVSLGGSAVQYSLPGGTLFCAAYVFRQYRRRGADDLLAGWTVLAFNAVTFVSLALLALVGLAMAASAGNAFDLAEGIVAIALVALLLVAAWTRRDGLIGPFTAVVRFSQRIVRRPDPGEDAADVVSRWVRHAKAVSPTRGDWLQIFVMGLSMWVADLACLTVSFLAVGADVPLRGLLLAYGAGQLAANLPVTPGGLGVVEGSITVALVTFGGGEASTVAAVLLYRLISFWLVLPIGWACIGTFALTGRHRALERRHA